MTTARSERRKQQLRDEILTAAHYLFVRQGVSVTTIQDICVRTGIANRTFFNHFAGRRELMQALADRHFSHVRVVEHDSSAQSGPNLIVAFFDAHAEVLAQLADANHELCAALIHAALLRGPRSSSLHADAVELVRRGAAQRAVSAPHDPETLADIIVGTFFAGAAERASAEPSSLVERLHGLGVTLANLLAPPNQRLRNDDTPRCGARPRPRPAQPSHQ